MSGRVVLVTGGNRGIGREICRKLVAAGDKVLLTSRDVAAGSEAAEAIEKEVGVKGGCEVLHYDALDSQSAELLVAAVAAKYSGKVDGLINNAAVTFRERWDAESFQIGKTTNVDAPVALTQKLSPHLAPGCRIVMVSSGLGQLAEIPVESQYYSGMASAATVEDLSAFRFLENDAMTDPPCILAPGRKNPVYRLTKAMLNRATQIFAQDASFVERNISVNAVTPGWCRTDMGGPDAERSVEQGADAVIWVLNHPDPSPTGKFFRDGRSIDW
ncbi:unnamed protein product [Ostreobium quekettii]|uniref:Uncharacterized protein n=1 Tax=Ostreobium quekettii TaxID=121088 RepID=A0A8S1IQC5_9CHLO|nr:unnamed protein product [Ostreobium quekettii]|eukprot:evm.model.scf_621EXC.4 EVM.evm.TU.scf_621EXC.4   scf_621EXC:49542-55562(+)